MLVAGLPHAQVDDPGPESGDAADEIDRFEDGGRIGQFDVVLGLIKRGEVDEHKIGVRRHARWPPRPPVPGSDSRHVRTVGAVTLEVTVGGSVAEGGVGIGRGERRVDILARIDSPVAVGGRRTRSRMAL